MRSEVGRIRKRSIDDARVHCQDARFLPAIGKEEAWPKEEKTWARPCTETVHVIEVEIVLYIILASGPPGPDPLP